MMTSCLLKEEVFMFFCVIIPLYSLTLFVLVQRKGAIAASNFPDYVQRVMREDEGNSSMLANEYMVSATTCELDVTLTIMVL